MPPSKHAVLSASGAHRWLHCNPSARLELEFADRETEAAAEGTAAHALAEHKLKKALKIRSRKPVSPYDCDEMDAHTDGYVEFVLEQLEEAKTLCADPLILIEQRLLLCAGRVRHRRLPDRGGQAPAHHRFQVRAGRPGGRGGKSPDDAVRPGRAPAVRPSL